MPISKMPPLRKTILLFAIATLLLGCEVERRKSDAELGLTSEQSAGRKIYDQDCHRCHAAYSSKSRQGPSLQSIYKKPYLEESGFPANDDRVTDIIRLGRNKMPGFAQVLNQQEIDNLLAYLHTL